MSIYKLRELSRVTDAYGDMGDVLADACDQHFDGFYARGSGVGYGSCNAAVAAKPVSRQGWSQGRTQRGSRGFSIVFGNSQMYRGLDHDNNTRLTSWNTRQIDRGREDGLRSNRNPFSNSTLEQHAEQSAILMAEEDYGLYSMDGLCFVYVDLAPCGSCEAWLEAHPKEWYVFYRYSYDSAGNSALLTQTRTERRGRR